jgi:hypothetical protein
MESGCCDGSHRASRMELSALALLQLAGLEQTTANVDDGAEFDQFSVTCPSISSNITSTSTSFSSSSSVSSSSSSYQRWTAEERSTLRLVVDQCNTSRMQWEKISTKTFSGARSNSQLRAMNNYMRGKITKPHDTLTNVTKRVYYCAKCKQPKRSPHQCAFEL